MKHILSLAITTFIVYSCDHIDHKLKVVNKSDYNISCYVTNSSHDSIKNHIEYYIEKYIKPSDTIDIIKFGGENEWERFISTKDKRLYFYFFDRLRAKFGIPTIGFGVANVITGFQGGEKLLPGSPLEATDIGLGGSGTIGQIGDIFSGGIEKDVFNGVMMGYGIYTSNIGQAIKVSC